ncbi:O-antigen ligase family protein [Solimonas fluminis]|uniref:O-antigen ligase family protein n=1 Tax=Solimonas fluminis TaxID=2086571 RepID=UPI0010573E7D|nr:O-antigen ligase family protein [Solimonas fluminis]
MINILCYAALMLAVLIPGMASIGAGPLWNLIFLAVVSIPVLQAWEFQLNRKPLVPQRKGMVVTLGIVYLLLLAIALVRGYLSQDSVIAAISYRSLLFSVMIGLAAGSWHIISTRSTQLPDLFTATIGALVAYCAINLLLFMLGFANATQDARGVQEQSVILSYFGISINRVLFPMAWGVNNYSVIAGAVLSAGLIYFNKVRRRNWRAWVFILVPIICCLLSDSRAALGFAITAAAGVLLTPRLSTFGLLALWMLSASLLLMTDSLESLTVAARDGQSTFTNREIIWAAGIAEISRFNSELIFGYGQFGQFFSGISRLYEMLFKDFGEHPELISVHNTYLQTVLDVGYVGLASLVLFLFTTVRSLGVMSRAAIDDWRPPAAQAMLLFLAANGLTEVTLSIYQPWILLILLSIMSLLRRSGRERAQVQVVARHLTSSH